MKEWQLVFKYPKVPTLRHFPLRQESNIEVSRIATNKSSDGGGGGYSFNFVFISYPECTLQCYFMQVLFSEPVVITACEFLEQNAAPSTSNISLVG
jgi:hypothetical protein